MLPFSLSKKLLRCLALLPMLVACATSSTQTEEPAAAPVVHWTYEGEEGPENWGELSPDFVLCSTGQAQTPIDITAAQQANAPDVAFAYQAAPLTILNNGHTIQVKSDGKSTIEVGGTQYTLLQYHFHTPSEHTVNGESFAMELHLVHQDANGNLAVVGLLIREGAEQSSFGPIIANMPTGAGDELTVDGVSLNAADFLPAEQRAYEYQGSLTTPPCSEEVSWFVMTSPIEVSADQIAALKAIMGENNRPIQELNSRTLVEDSGPD